MAKECIIKIKRGDKVKTFYDLKILYTFIGGNTLEYIFTPINSSMFYNLKSILSITNIFKWDDLRDMNVTDWIYCTLELLEKVIRKK